MQPGSRYAARALAALARASFATGAALVAVPHAAAAGAPAAKEFAPEDMAAQPAHSGAWHDADRVGHGLVLNVLGPYEAAITWNTFTPDNKPLWLVGTGRIEANRIVFALVTATGAAFPTAATGVAPVVSNWGQLVMTFQTCTDATIRWTPTAAGYSAGSARITRLTVPAGLVCDDDSSLFQHSMLGAPNAAAATLAEGKSLVAVGGEVILGTKDGLWRRKIDGNDEWERAGLPGFDVSFVVKDESGEGRLFAGGIPKDASEKPFYVSYDAGRTWENARSAFFDPLRNRHEGFADIAVYPKDPLVMYASFEGGPGLAVSTNGGRDWKRADSSSDSYIGYPCRISFVPGDDERLYQGCEALLDMVRIGYFDLDENAPGRVGELEVLAGTAVEGKPDVDNRRPNLLLGSPARPGWLYAGLEGALVAIKGGQLERVYFSPLDADPASNPHPYLYVSAVWIDPTNPFHVIFGGGLNGENHSPRLYETYDHGLKLRDIGLDQQSATLPNPVVDSLHSLDARGDRFVYSVKTSDPARTRITPNVFRLDRRRGIALPTAR